MLYYEDHSRFGLLLNLGDWLINLFEHSEQIFRYILKYALQLAANESSSFNEIFVGNTILPVSCQRRL